MERGDTVYWPGHGGPTRTPKRFVRGLIAHRQMREASILERIRQGDRTVSDVVRTVYRGVDERLHGAAALSALAHVEHLIAQGKVACEGAASLTARLKAIEATPKALERSSKRLRPFRRLPGWCRSGCTAVLNVSARARPLPELETLIPTVAARYMRLPGLERIACGRSIDACRPELPPCRRDVQARPSRIWPPRERYGFCTTESARKPTKWRKSRAAGPGTEWR